MANGMRSTLPAPRLLGWYPEDPDLARLHIPLDTWYERVDSKCECDGVCVCDAASLAASGGSPCGPAGAAAGSEGELSTPDDGGRE